MDNENKEQLSESQGIFAELRSDVDHILRAENKGQEYVYPDPVVLNQRERRIAVRAIFALIEGVSHDMRQLLITSTTAMISENTRLALQELQIDVTPNGTLKLKPLKVSAVSMLRLTLNVFHTSRYQVDGTWLQESYFEKLTSSARVRDRLMHPKTVHALVVTDEEIRTIAKVFEWFGKVHVSVLLGVIATYRKIVAAGPST